MGSKGITVLLTRTTTRFRATHGAPHFRRAETRKRDAAYAAPDASDGKAGTGRAGVRTNGPLAVRLRRAASSSTGGVIICMMGLMPACAKRP